MITDPSAMMRGHHRIVLHNLLRSMYIRQEKDDLAPLIGGQVSPGPGGLQFLISDLAAIRYRGGHEYIMTPILLIDVVTPASLHYDYGTKLPRYQKLPSAMEILLVRCDQVRVDLFRRREVVGRNGLPEPQQNGPAGSGQLGTSGSDGSGPADEWGWDTETSLDRRFALTSIGVEIDMIDLYHHLTDRIAGQ